MSVPGRNAAGVSTAYVSFSDDPPPYSTCVLYPPTIYTNYPETHSSLLDDPPVFPGREIPNSGIQTGNYLHEGRPSAPFLDVPSTSENPPGVHEPRVAPYNGQPECKPSCPATPGNPLTYIHEQKTIYIRRSSSTTPRHNKPFAGLCTAILVCITISTIVIAATRSQFNKTRKTHYHDIPDIYEERKIKPVYKDDSHRTFDFGDRRTMNILDFEKMRRDMDERIRKILSSVRTEKNNETYRNNDVDLSLGDNVGDIIKNYAHKDFAVKSREVDVDPNLDDVTDWILKKSGKEDDDSSESNFEQKYPNFADVLKARSNKFGDQKFWEILGIPGKENFDRKPPWDQDS